MRCPVSKCMPETVLDSGSIGCAQTYDVAVSTDTDTDTDTISIADTFLEIERV